MFKTQKRGRATTASVLVYHENKCFPRILQADFLSVLLARIGPHATLLSLAAKDAWNPGGRGHDHTWPQDVRSQEEAESGCQLDNQSFLPQVAWPFTTWMFYLYLLFFLNPNIQAPLWVCSESQSMRLSTS